MTPDPGASRVDELRRRLVMQIRQLAALEKVIAAAEWQERELAKDLANELQKRRGAGRPHELGRLDPVARSELLLEVIRLSLRRVSRREIARKTGLSRRQVDNILGEDEAA